MSDALNQETNSVPTAPGAVSGDKLAELRANIGASVVADLAAMLQVHSELTDALLKAGQPDVGHIPAPGSAPASLVPVPAAAEISQHLDAMEQAIADHGSAGGSVLSGLIDLIRSKL